MAYFFFRYIGTTLRIKKKEKKIKDNKGEQKELTTNMYADMIEDDKEHIKTDLAFS